MNLVEYNVRTTIRDLLKDFYTTSLTKQELRKIVINKLGCHSIDQTCHLNNTSNKYHIWKVKSKNGLYMYKYNCHNGIIELMGVK